MPCQSSPASGQPSLPASYQTLSECLQACKEGACCEGTTCTVKPQCQCQGSGTVFKGAGTTCSPSPCTVCVCRQAIENPENVAFPSLSGDTVSADEATSRTLMPETVTVTYYSNETGFSPPPAAFTGSYVLRRQACVYLWSASITANGSQWTMYFGQTPPSANDTSAEPGLWVANEVGMPYFGLAGFLFGNIAGALNMAQAINRICYGGAIEFATFSGNYTASVSINPLP